jgi:DNA-binding MarR family transcriptional regulator
MTARKTPALKAADPADPAFTMAHSPIYWTARVIQRYTRDMDAVLKRIGMDVPRWRVLMILVEINPASVTQLAEHGVMKLSTMTKTVQRLETDGFVATRPRKTDARVTEVTLTAKGRKVVGIVRAQASRIFHQAFEGSNDRDVERLNTLLQRIFTNLDSVPH